VRANVDDTPEKEWVIEYDTGPRRFLILRKERGEWRRVFAKDGLTQGVGLQDLRDLDGDGVLEVVLSAIEGDCGFDALGFRSGRFRLLPGARLRVADSACCDESGFVDLEGDGALEFVATGFRPGYLAALAPEEADPCSPGELRHDDVRFYRLTENGYVLCFPQPWDVLRGLQAGLVSGYPETRCVCAKVAGLLRVEACVSRLQHLLADPEVAYVAAPALARVATPTAVAALVSMVESDKSSLAHFAYCEGAEAWHEIDDPRFVEALLRVWDDSAGPVREMVAAKLGTTRHPQAVPTLFHYYLLDEEKQIRDCALAALRSQWKSAGKPDIVELLRDPSKALSPEAAERVAEMGVAALTGLLDSPGDESERATGPSAPWLLSDLGEQVTVPRLLERLQENPALGATVVEALAFIEGPEAVSALRGLQTVPDVETSAAATLALVDLGAPDSLELLLELSRSGNHEAKRRLAQIPGDQVEQELVRSLTEDAPAPNASVWGDLCYAEYGAGYVPGWFLCTSKRLGEEAEPLLMSRVERTLPSHLGVGVTANDGDYGGAVAAAHCLRELGVVEAIPLLQEMSATHPTTEGREVAMWSLVSLRRMAAGIAGPLFATAEP